MIRRYLELGQVVGAHGVRGELRVNPWCDTPDFARRFKTLYWDNNGEQPVTVLSCRPHGNIVLLSLEGVTSKEAAEALRGRMLYLKREDAKLAPGTWFIEELIGCEAVDADDGRRYGTLTDVSRTGANDVWHVTGEDGKEYLLPAIPDVVIDADVAADRVLIRPLKGIFDDAD